MSRKHKYTGQPMAVSDKLCECGCGQKTYISPYTSSKLGYVMGEPRKFRPHHSNRMIDKMPEPNSSGLCQCGCGGEAPIANSTIVSRGVVEGKPMRFIQGHATKARFKLGFPEGTIIDPEDEHLSGLCKWWINHHGYIQGVIRDGGPRTFLHRVIMNCPDDMVIDHINGDPLDNRRCNLRVVTIAENNLNRSRSSRRNKSGYRNVYWKSDIQKWYVAFNIKSKTIVGYYEKLEDAVAKADQYRAENGIPAW